MGYYQFKEEMVVDAPIEKVWDFISDPRNLKVITPPKMGFLITSEGLPEKIYPGMIISYKVKPLLNISMTWVTQISLVRDKHYFVDEQLIGPYKIWHHQHFLEEKGDQTIMKDIVSYQPPLGILGSIANSLFIRSQLKDIFAFRQVAVEKYFKEN